MDGIGVAGLRARDSWLAGWPPLGQHVNVPAAQPDD